jgi:hypothetical protein
VDLWNQQLTGKVPEIVLILKDLPIKFSRISYLAAIFPSLKIRDIYPFAIHAGDLRCVTRYGIVKELAGKN